MDYNAFIEKLHEVLLDRVADKKHLIHEISEVLHISSDAVYKKIRFESKFSLEEILILCEKYKISFDNILSSARPDNILFKTPFLNKKIKSPKDYLLALEASFGKLRNALHPKIIYSTRELPVFYHFLHPVLTTFKLFVFSKSVWEIPQFIDSSYDHEMFDSEVFVLVDRLWAQYSNIDSEEFWTINVLDITIQQVQYLKNCRKISNENIARLKSALVEVLDKCYKMTEVNSKQLNKKVQNFYLYENKILHTSNHIMIHSDTMDLMYITYDSPNFIYTEDKQFLEYSKYWHEKIKRNSYFIGEGTGHLRFQFFEDLKNKLNEI